MGYLMPKKNRSDMFWTIAWIIRGFNSFPKVWFNVVYGILTIVRYLKQNQFLYI